MGPRAPGAGWPAVAAPAASPAEPSVRQQAPRVASGSRPTVRDVPGSSDAVSRTTRPGRGPGRSLRGLRGGLPRLRRTPVRASARLDAAADDHGRLLTVGLELRGLRGGTPARGP